MVKGKNKDNVSLLYPVGFYENSGMSAIKVQWHSQPPTSIEQDDKNSEGNIIYNHREEENKNAFNAEDIDQKKQTKRMQEIQERLNYMNEQMLKYQESLLRQHQEMQEKQAKHLDMIDRTFKNESEKYKDVPDEKGASRYREDNAKSIEL
ncbi:hypothetical protein ROZALSC1DRAFT_27259 [Rozella allomycis CSF55]|uniref:Uncharacterized protein n=1 Tax=Rozella allomycis (strain CSF55) TaxID=988480 RepID=A0A075AWL0_ROZAC|nr:hypothetical protein O9G_001909 [Rozella allomycis CSF55]RKP21330.1 hypothetical protein ROZALSC1DRAFT_27259 [Rozella allomycis CSF55]|eukprot:EPZ34607.1 hypothetical protein O9G_001909 [Rozella allomycis CSF55]